MNKIYIIMAICLILACVSTVIYLYKKGKKISSIIISIVVLVLIIGGGYKLTHKTSSEVWVKGVNNVNEFTFKLVNQKIKSNGYIYSFRSEVELSDIEDIVSNQYDDYTLEKNSIKIFDDNQYFIIDALGTGRLKSYKVYGDYVSYYDEEENVTIEFPFPLDGITKQSVKKKFYTSYTFDELKEYYEPFSNVEIEENKITINGEAKVILSYNKKKKKLTIKEYEI